MKPATVVQTIGNTQLSPPNQLKDAPSSETDQLQSIAPARSAPSIADYLRAAVSSNTRRAYRGDLADFERFGGSVPCSPEVLAEYIAFRSATQSPHTVSRRVVGICRAHKSLGLADPAKNDLVRTVLRGARRTHGAPQRRATPLLNTDLLVCIPKGASPIKVRDRAVLLLGFASALRRSELVSLDVDDLAFVAEGLLVHVKRGKTDQEGDGRQIAVPYGRTTLCPVSAVQQWLALRAQSSGPLFVKVCKSGQQGLTRLAAGSVNLIVKRAVDSCGMDASGYSGHSLRAGLVTSAARAGVPAHKIMEQTGHRSLAMLTRYIRDAQVFEENAAGAVL